MEWEGGGDRRRRVGVTGRRRYPLGIWLGHGGLFRYLFRYIVWNIQAIVTVLSSRTCLHYSIKRSNLLSTGNSIALVFNASHKTP